MQQIADTSPHALDQAVAYWQQQRYQVAYHDDYLAQLVRREMPEKILAVTALAALITLGAIIVVRLKKRPWRIVLLAEKGFSPPQAAGFQPRRLGASRL